MCFFQLCLSLFIMLPPPQLLARSSNLIFEVIVSTLCRIVCLYAIDCPVTRFPDWLKIAGLNNEHASVRNSDWLSTAAVRMQAGCSGLLFL